MEKERKDEVVTFKCPKSLVEALNATGNRSEFIRNAVAAALMRRCAACHGSGLLPAHVSNNE